MNLVREFATLVNLHSGPKWDSYKQVWACGCGQEFPPVLVNGRFHLWEVYSLHVGKALEYVTPCNCILSSYGSGFEEHTYGDHEDEGCKATYTLSGPPCGGCINCVAAQAYYYLTKEN